MHSREKDRIIKNGRKLFVRKQARSSVLEIPYPSDIPMVEVMAAVKSLRLQVPDFISTMAGKETRMCSSRI